MERDVATFNRGNGQPTGTVAEIRTASNLQVEYDGKLVYKDLGAPNSAVHTEKSGSDVVQRAIELTALENAAEGDMGSVGITEGCQQPVAQNHAGEAVGEGTNGKSAPKKRAPRKKASAAATAGEKREREVEEELDPAPVTTEGATEREIAENVTGKRTKKGRAAKAEAGEKKKPRVRPRKASIVKNVPQEGEPSQVHSNAGQVGEGEEADNVPKKRGPGRPRKSDTASSPVQYTPVNGNAPAANTRSRNE